MHKVERLRRSLTLEEKAQLTAGGGIMSTAGVERVGIPAFNVTDGPSAARGPSLPGIDGPTSTVIPCGSAVGATWNPALAEQLGALLGREARDRNCRGLLAPTVNLHRFPLAGRNFECYSEDPLHSGIMAAGFIKGVQSSGVFATVKHFVGNDAETQRSWMNSVIDERSLRELYLVPFEIAIRDGGAMAIMTGYNRLNGRWITEQPELLTGVLRREWGFEGLVMTDWFGVATPESLPAGLDLEMPGPPRAFGAALIAAVESGQIKESDLDRAVDQFLKVFDAFGGLNESEVASVPPPPTPEDLELVKSAAAEATVLLTNDGVLPLDVEEIRRVAIVGPNATSPCIVGGGSAEANPTASSTPLQSFKRIFGDRVELTYSRGCEVGNRVLPVGKNVLEAFDGFDVHLFDGPRFEGEPIRVQRMEELRLCVMGDDESYPGGAWSMRVSGTVTPSESGRFELLLAQAGSARVSVDGVVILDGIDDPPEPGGTEFFGRASKDAAAELSFQEGRPAEVVVDFVRREETVAGFRVGFRTLDGERLIEHAEANAAAADVVIVLVGSSAAWEGEAIDRDSFELPGRQNELIQRIARTNEKVVVVVNSGAPIDMEWVDGVSAALQCWLGGQGMADAIAEIVVGESDPGGRLPTTIPKELRHSPAFDTFPGENAEHRYGDGLFMGYRGYENSGIEPRFPFGHGLTYSTFRVGEPSFSDLNFQPGETLTISVPVSNAGDRAGSEVVQCYVEPVSPRLKRPIKELKSFAKVRLEAGQSQNIELQLDDRSFAYWDSGQPDFDAVADKLNSTLTYFESPQPPREPGWQVDAGRYVVHIGTSSSNISWSTSVFVGASENAHDQIKESKA